MRILNKMTLLQQINAILVFGIICLIICIVFIQEAQKERKRRIERDKMIQYYNKLNVINKKGKK